MKVAVISTPHERTPPERYGGTERVVHYLVEELVRRGVKIALFATGNSLTRASLKYVVEKPVRPYREDVEIAHVNYAISEILKGDFDIVHNHCNGPGLALISRLGSIPAVSTLHCYFREKEWRKLGVEEEHPLIAISNRQREVHFFIRSFVATIHNAIRPEEYPFRRDKEDFLLFVGLVAPHKGVHYAIHTAKKLGMQLLLAGKLEQKHMAYFEKYVKPHLGDGIKYLGEVSEAEKRELMARAKCLLFTSIYEEPFGIVMIEALACGTPVVAFSNGAAREIIKNGEVGFLAKDFEGFCSSVKKALFEIDPAKCRRYVEEHFSVERAADKHLEVYRRVIAGFREQRPALLPTAPFQASISASFARAET